MATCDEELSIADQKINAARTARDAQLMIKSVTPVLSRAGEIINILDKTTKGLEDLNSARSNTSSTSTVTQPEKDAYNTFVDKYSANSARVLGKAIADAGAAGANPDDKLFDTDAKLDPAVADFVDTASSQTLAHLQPAVLAIISSDQFKGEVKRILSEATGNNKAEILTKLKELIVVRSARGGKKRTRKARKARKAKKSKKRLPSKKRKARKSMRKH